MPSATAHGYRSSGFTLIELGMIIATTAIVGAVGVSAYRTYVVRAQIAASVAAAAPLQRIVEIAFRTTGLAPTQPGIPAAGVDAAQYVESVSVTDGRVEISFGAGADEALAGRALSITPFEAADMSIVWICGNKTPGPGLEPLGFAGGGPQATQLLSAIEARYLPPNCR
jgi:Tfp pilus assembly protein PilE